MCGPPRVSVSRQQALSIADSELSTLWAVFEPSVCCCFAVGPCYAYGLVGLLSMSAQGCCCPSVPQTMWSMVERVHEVCIRLASSALTQNVLK
jgi:hypothetical protein